jgi:hypothetical protein
MAGRRMPTLKEIADNSAGTLDVIEKRLQTVSSIVRMNEERLLAAYDEQLTNRAWAKTELHFFYDKLANFRDDLALTIKRIQRGTLTSLARPKPYDTTAYQVDDAVIVMGANNAYLILLANILWARAAGAALSFRPGHVQTPVHRTLKTIIAENITRRNSNPEVSRDLAWMFRNLDSDFAETNLLVEMNGPQFIQTYLQEASTTHHTKFMIFTGASPANWPNVQRAFRSHPNLTGLIEGSGNDRMYIEQGADLAEAVRIAFAGFGSNGGMLCMRPKVLFVHECDYANLKDQIKQRIVRIHHGLPTDDRTVVGVMPVRSALPPDNDGSLKYGFLSLAKDALNRSDTELIAVGNYQNRVDVGNLLYSLSADRRSPIQIFTHPGCDEMAYVPAIVMSPAASFSGCCDARAIHAEMFGPALIVVRVPNGHAGIEVVRSYLSDDKHPQLTFTFVGSAGGLLHRSMTALMEPKVAEIYTNVSLFDSGQFGRKTIWGTGPAGCCQTSARVYFSHGDIVVEPAGRRDFIEAFTHTT